MSQDKCTIHVNGVELEARPGQMLIEVTDAAGVYVPRFCYHEKLSIAANCRMCLVEVENAPKPMPACATPVTPGMKVHTKSAKAIGAQKATMEFLLINHPLDCPICDQGGECELQDIAMGFGRGVSRFVERKRVVRDKDIGPLVSTDMTRCIHCTRCVRFTQEIAGFQELGTIGRGDRVEISPYIERSVNHELSGNIIDLCPVGALNSKPYRFSARAWEMSQRPTIAAHDCVGSNIFAHVMDGRVKRVVPRACEDINENWISDRDRFSYEGCGSDDRLLEPMLRVDDGWRAASWDEALASVSARLAGASRESGVGALVSPSATVEEGYLLSRLMDRLGSANIDHRLRRRDFRRQATEPVVPWLGMPIAEIENLDQILVVGSNLRKEVPILGHRVRKAAIRGAGVHLVNPLPYPYLFPVATRLERSDADFVSDLACMVKAAGAGEEKSTASLAVLLASAPNPGDRHEQVIKALTAGKSSAVFVGLIADRHPRRAEIMLLAGELARRTGSRLGLISEGSNSAGLAMAGALPSHAPGLKPRPHQGRTAREMILSPPQAMLLLHVEPDQDCSSPAVGVSGYGSFVVSLTPYMTDWHRRHAHVVLPVGTSFETSGTFVNAEGRWQSFEAVAALPGESRPAWKVLRVLCSQADVKDADYASSGQIREEVRRLVPTTLPDLLAAGGALEGLASGETTRTADLDVPMYQVDGLVRRAEALQQTRDALDAGVVDDMRRRA